VQQAPEDKKVDGKVKNEHKLAELILYISQKCADDPTYGSVKLNKILCFSDFLFHAYHHRGITNVEYQKLPNGPAPRPLVSVRDYLIKNGALGMQEVQLRGGHVQKRPVNLRPPDLSKFNGAEIAVVDGFIEQFKGASADRTSEISHELVGWLVVDENETIPYRTFLFSNPPISDEERTRARELKSKMGNKSKKRQHATS
jgi:Protein of unknown function (DUF4065)